MKIKCSFEKLVSIGDLKENPKNKKLHPYNDDLIDRLAKVIEYQGMRKPIVVSNLSGNIVTGHATLRALKKLKWEEAPVDFQDFDNVDQELAHLIADNSLTYWREIELSEVNLLIPEFDGIDFDIDLLGIESFVVEPVEKYDKDKEDDVPEVKEDPKIQLGDLIELGNHRLFCGDSTIKENVDYLMNGEKADITFTSPPYNAGKSIRGNFYKNNDDNMNEEDYLLFLDNFTLNCLDYSNYVFVNIGMLESNKATIIKYASKHPIKDILMWNKKTSPPHINKGTFSTKHEFVFVFSKENSKSRGFPCKWQGKYSNVIETENNSSNEFVKEHKAGFPVAFPLWVIEKMDFAKAVYDPFMGTGTTFIACEKTNRKCFGMELDPQYADVIIKRWCQYTGISEFKVNGETKTMEWFNEI